MKPKLTRRNLLRGAGVALALPWLESLAPRRARGQAAVARKRFVPVYFPLGTASFWTPKTTGAGNAWQLSPILAPLAPVKASVTVLSHVDNTAYGRANVEPIYPRETGSFLTCAPAQGTPLQNGTSVDQVIADQLSGSIAPLPSLQLGLSTLDSYAEDLPPAFLGGISWRSPTSPMFKQIDPQAVFDALVRAGTPNAPFADSAALARAATNKSVLDFVLADASALRPRLGVTDRVRVDQFLTSVRDLETRTQAIAMPVPNCRPVARPAASIAVGNVPAGYNRDDHANVMIDLMVMALSCDLTRVISFMLDDARSDFSYDFLTERTFTDAGSTPGTVPLAGYRGTAKTGPMNNGYATINFWFVSKLAALCQKLAALPEDDGRSVLDNSVVWFGSGMHSAQDHSLFNLPLLYVGSGGGVLKVDQHLNFAADRRLSDVYLTFIQRVFGEVSVTAFGDSQGIVTDILA